MGNSSKFPLFLRIDYLYPPTALVVADSACSRPYPQGTCPLAHSIAPPLREKTSLTLWIFRGFAMGRQVGKVVGLLIIYTHPPPFYGTFSLAGKRGRIIGGKCTPKALFRFRRQTFPEALFRFRQPIPPGSFIPALTTCTPSVRKLYSVFGCLSRPEALFRFRRPIPPGGFIPALTTCASERINPGGICSLHDLPPGDPRKGHRQIM